jgi:hypothetical protein
MAFSPQVTILTMGPHNIDVPLYSSEIIMHNLVADFESIYM